MELRKRKHIRLKNYDYSNYGYYYVTINTQGNLPFLADVGYSPEYPNNATLSQIGLVANDQIYELEQRFTNIRIDNYAIMPTHIHMIIAIGKRSEKVIDLSSCSLFDIVCAYKSITTRICNKEQNMPGRKIFQTSYYEEIIRTASAYNAISHYIDNNPLNWNETH